MVDNIFLQISVILGITVSIAFVMRLLRQPLIAAYIIAGLIVGPLFLNLVNGGEEFFETFAKFGIVLLLFIVGLSLNFDFIKKLGKVVLIGSLIHFFFTAFFGFLIMKLLDFSLITSLFIGVAITFSSTIIVIKLLSDKRDIETLYGRYVVGILLVQDVIAVVIMIFLNTSYGSTDAWYSLILTIAGKGLLLVGVVFLMAKYLLPWIMDRVAKSGELLFIFTIAWCFGVASFIYWAGFSIEIGAIIAGISLGASVYQAEISSRIRPLRDFFIVLFFVVLGSELQLGDIWVAITPAVILAVFVLIADPVILYLVMRKMGYTRRNSFLAGITAAQVSEFGFIIVFKGEELGYLQGPELAIMTLTALVTIIISSYLITYNEKVYGFFRPWLYRFGKNEKLQVEDEVKDFPVWVIGYHRIGWKVCEALAGKNIKFGVIDFNPEAISKLRHRDIPAFFGDASDIEFLEDLPLQKAKMIIMTIPEPEDEIILIRYIRKLNSKALIVGNLNYSVYLDDLYEAGANYVMLPHLLGGQWMAEVLKNHPWTKKTFKDLRHDQKNEMKLRFTMGTHG